MLKVSSRCQTSDGRSLVCKNVNGQIKKRTRVVGLFPSEESLLRLVTGVLIEISETWETGKIYLTPN
jgi:putative transposase